MTTETIVKPLAEPFIIEQVKAQITFSDDDDDALIDMQISHARQKVETHLRQRLITQTVRLTLDCFSARICIPVWPVQSISKIDYTDTDGVVQTLAVSEYQLVKSRKPNEIAPAYLKVWPTTRADFDAVKIDVVVGYGNTGNDVPGDILQAILLTVGDYYEHREDTVSGAALSSLPNGVKDLLAPHIFWV